MLNFISLVNIIIIFSLICIFIFFNFFNILIFVTCVLFLYIVFIVFSSCLIRVSSFYILSSYMWINQLSYLLVWLSLFLILMVITTLRTFFIRLSKTTLIMLITLIRVFFLKKIFLFYFAFEAALLPISIMILGWGYQPERLSSFFYIFIYTVISSIPFLALLGVFYANFNFSTFTEWQSTSTYLQLDRVRLSEHLMTFFLILGFLVKFPLYLVHLWLPKAHVEAPVSGSIILAGLLLKLGGFGLFLILPFLTSEKILIITSSVSGLGGVITALICLREIDLKVLIAYSSIVHISISIIGLCLKSSFSVLVAILVIIRHGLSSPLIFLGAYFIYEQSHSRNILLRNANLWVRPFFSMWWFIAIMANIGTPPTFNFCAELLRIIAIYSLRSVFFLQISLLVFIRGAYNLIVYSRTQQGQKKEGIVSRSSANLIQHLNLFSLVLPIFIISIALDVFRLC